MGRGLSAESDMIVPQTPLLDLFSLSATTVALSSCHSQPHQRKSSGSTLKKMRDVVTRT